MAKIFAIGDIHGYFDKLLSLMARIDITRQEDTIVFLGDYINKGPQSSEIVDYFLDLSRDGYHAVFLKGNHEVLFQYYLSGKIDENHYSLLCKTKTLDSYKRKSQDPIIPPSHRAFFSSLRLYYETDSYIFVHAGLRPGVPLQEQRERDLVKIREEFIHSSYDFGKTVIFGHTPFHVPFVTRNKIGIDTGAGKGRSLTCLELPARKFYSAS